MRIAILALLAAASAGATTHCVTIAGLGGEPDYEQRFAAWAQEMEKTLRAAAPMLQVETLSGPDGHERKHQAPRSRPLRKKPSRRIRLLSCCSATEPSTEPNTRSISPARTYQPTELATMLDRMHAGRQLIVNATSASGGSVHALLRPEPHGDHRDQGGHRKECDRVPPLLDRSAARCRRRYRQERSDHGARSVQVRAELRPSSFTKRNKRLATEHPTLEWRRCECAAGRGALRAAADRLDSEGRQRSGQARPFERNGSNSNADRSLEVPEGRHADGRIQAPAPGTAARTGADAGGDR